MTEALWKVKQVGEMLLICSTDGQPSDADLEISLALHRSNKVKTAILWALGNTTASAAQRKRSAADMRDHKNYVMTTSALTRGIITAISWLGQPMKACAPEELRSAIRDLGVPRGFTEQQVVDAMNELKAETEVALRARQRSVL